MTSATKLIALVLLFAAGAFAVQRLAQRPKPGVTEKAPVEDAAADTRIKAVKAPKRRSGKDYAGAAEKSAGSPAPPSAAQAEEREKRIAVLSGELATSSPEVIRADGETTGRLHFNIEVVNEAGLPVPGATVDMKGRRTTGPTKASWYFWGAPAVKEITNEKGLARVSAEVFVTENIPLGGVTFEVTHPDYAPAEADMELDKLTKVVLTSGWNFPLIVTDEESSKPLHGDIKIHFSSRFKIDWSQQPSGIINVRNISEKSLELYVTRHDGNTTATSDYVTVNLPRLSREPVYVALHPTYTVRGRLSDNVPRPVRNGQVEANHAATEGACGRYLTRSVAIQPDGTFELPDMAPGKIMVWALADGWCSELPDGKRLAFGAPQQFELTEKSADYVLPMVKTATAIFHLVQPDGQPAAGATVSTSPNMCRERCCGIWIRNHAFMTTSTVEGVAVLPDLPPLNNSRYYISGTYELPPQPVKNDPSRLDRVLQYDLEPGQVLEQTITVYPEGSITIQQKDDRMTTAPGPNYAGP